MSSSFFDADRENEMPLPEFLSLIALVVYVLCVAVIDVRTHRIPNVLTAIAATTAFVLHAIAGGFEGVIAGLCGLFIGFAVFLPFYILRAFGAGDVKAMAAVGAFLGFKGGLIATAATLMAGGAIGIGVMLWRAWRGGGAWYRPFYRLVGTLSLPGAGMSVPLSPSNGTTSIQRFPYGTAIAVGTLAALIWLGQVRLPLAAS